MSAYSVADAEAGLLSLIDRALAGEEVIITRNGEPVVELRPTVDTVAAEKRAATARFLANRFKPPPGTPTSVELLNMIYDEPNG